MYKFTCGPRGQAFEFESLSFFDNGNYNDYDLLELIRHRRWFSVKIKGNDFTIKNVYDNNKYLVGSKIYINEDPLIYWEQLLFGTIFITQSAYKYYWTDHDMICDDGCYTFDKLCNWYVRVGLMKWAKEK